MLFFVWFESWDSRAVLVTILGKGFEMGTLMSKKGSIVLGRVGFSILENILFSGVHFSFPKPNITKVRMELLSYASL